MKSREIWRRVLVLVLIIVLSGQLLFAPYNSKFALLVVIGTFLFLYFFSAAINNAGCPCPCEDLEPGVQFIIRKIDDTNGVMVVKKLEGSLKGSMWLVSFPVTQTNLIDRNEDMVFVISRNTFLFVDNKGKTGQSHKPRL